MKRPVVTLFLSKPQRHRRVDWLVGRASLLEYQINIKLNSTQQQPRRVHE